MKIGLLGGGQLGRMIAQEGAKLGHSFMSWDPVADGPAQQVCAAAVVAPFDDAAAEDEFRSTCDVVTFEWENVPADLAERLGAVPSARVLRVVQDRLAQREFLAKHGFPQTEFKRVDKACDASFFPSILKTRRHGYDGKGQTRLAKAEDVPSGPLEHILEAKVPFTKEVSVVLARTANGETAVYPVAENVHRNGILHTTLAPARVSDKVAKKAADLALAIAAKLDYVGVMAVELFVVGENLLVNELAPRVHNSGHYTWGACATSQFEQHVRAVSGMPLGPTTQKSPAVMINLLGDLWENGEPDWKKLPPGALLTLYGKKQAKPGRKMGHVVLLGDAEKALAGADALLAALKR